jgi:hypothetical protein
MISKISILLLGFTCAVFPQKDIRIISSNQSSIIIEYTPVYSDTSIRTIENQKFLDVVVSFGHRLMIGVPSESGNIIRVLSSSFKEISGKLTPLPFYEKDGDLNIPVYITTQEYFNYTDYPELVTFGDYGISRNLGIQAIRILPVKFDVKTNIIRLYKKIVFQIDFASAQFSGSEVEDDLLQYSIINYNAAKSWIKQDKRLAKVVNGSVLATGNWVKFETPDEGIYKIDRAMLESFGFDPSSIDPRTIKIYNNGGKILSENAGSSRPIDLIENAILVFGENDGNFDSGDYILFYGRSTSFREYDESTRTIKRLIHPYSDKNFYWITYGGVNGKRIQNKSSYNGAAQFEQTTTKAFTDFEEDKINLAKTGRQFFGDDFSQSITTRSYLNNLNGRVTSAPINYKFRFVNASTGAVTLNLSENTTSIFNKSLTGYNNASYTFGVAHTETAEFNGTLPDNRSVLKFNFNATSVTSVGYLDYFEISYEKELKSFDNKILFFSKDTTAIIEYYLYGFPSTNIKVFDITESDNVKFITDHVLLSGGDCRFRVSEEKDTVRKYFAVGNDIFLTPINPVAVENSNLRGIDEGAKFIIITHKNFSGQAERLKTYRETESKIPISTIVVDVETIYNEFSGGILDVSAIRDFIKYAFDNWQVKPEFFLLFGKGTFDYKNIEGFNDNFIPTWQTEESLKLIFGADSYTSDDFFARVDAADLMPDLAFGRITAREEDEARNYIDKIIHYENNSERGNWRNLITLVADDGYTSNRYEGSEHTAPSEGLANTIIPPSFDLKKIYAADYPVVITGNGRRKPTVNVDILKVMNSGTLLINYIGHGNPDLWAHEFIFERSAAIPQLKNENYFFLCAATCDFGYYDIPNFQSGAEELMFLPNAGCIATFNSARLVFSGQNQALNKTLMTNLLDLPREEFNLPVPIGFSVFRTKLEWNNVNAQKFHLFGDPTLRLLIPQYFGNIDSLNGQPLNGLVQVKALSNTRISGTILKPDSSKWNDFNGEGILTVYDSERIKLLEEIDNYPMVIPGGVIFRGRVSAINGEFEAEFVVPKDISYENKNGKIIFYFLNSYSDGLAFSNQIIVGGTDTTAVNDGEGPEIEIFFDDASYYNAYLVGPEPKLIIKLSDETGLNTTGTGVGHKLEGILNEDEGSPIDFTEFFTGELDAGGKRGEVNYQFSKLNEGDYLLDVKAWDVFNNFSSEGSNFTVISTDDLVVRYVYNYPNPFSSNTTFTFQHNLNRPVDVRIKVYTIAGRMIKEIEQRNINQKFVKINWNGRDADGDQLANGTYLYKLIVKTTDGEYSESIIGKMAVIK